MMCHYKELYLNKFNTSLINPPLSAFQKVTRLVGTALDKQKPLTTPTPLNIAVLAPGWGAEGGGIISWTSHLKQIFIYIFIQLLNFI